jgi:hypothetical protein
LLPESSHTMTRDELIATVKRCNADTLLAQRLRESLGLPRVSTRKRHGKTKHNNAHKYHGVRDCMQQKHGVRP